MRILKLSDLCNYRWTFWSLKGKFEVQDARRQPIMTIEGPCCPCSCGSDVEFRVSLYYPNALILGDPGSDSWDGKENDTYTIMQN